MFRIRKIDDDSTAANREAIAQIETIISAQFPGWRPRESERILPRLRDPARFGYRLILLSAETARGKVRAFAAVMHFADLGVAFLDLISAAPQATGRGIGAALYQQVREEALALRCKHLFLECAVDDPVIIDKPATLTENRKRLRFYEGLGVVPIINNDFASSVHPGDRDLYFLLWDGLGNKQQPRRDEVRKAVKAILERRYPHLFTPERIKAVMESFKDDPAVLRPFRYVKAETSVRAVPATSRRGIALVVNEGHDIHHVRDRGYVEAPVRIPVILREIDKLGLFERIAPRRAPDALLRRVHDPAMLKYLQEACAALPDNKSIYPIIFPVRNLTRPPADPELAVGYYCTDTFTPLHHNVWSAARGAVDCAVTAADALFDGHRLAYALVRPPGHHAERRVYGGFCYLNAAAVAAEHLSEFGRVAILDVDYHHGNGTQDIFYKRADVLTVSIHGEPPTVYPHFAGFADETGEGDGKGYNLNLPLPEKIDPRRYMKTLDKALKRIQEFSPAYLLICLGLDTAQLDPTGTWPLHGDDFTACGLRIGKLGLPTLVVQEGGYRTRTLGINAKHFFAGLWQAQDRQHQAPKK